MFWYLPFLSQEASKEKIDQFKQTFLNSLHQILYLTLPASALLLVLRIPLVRIVYGAKEFPWSATILTGKAIAIFSLSIFAQSATHLLTRSFYALQNTKTPFFLALVSVVTNISLAAVLIFVFDLGILGLAIAMSFSAILHASLLLIFLYRSLGGFSIKLFSIPLLKMFIATFITGIFLWVPMRILDQFVFDTTRTIPLIILTIIASGIGFTVYLLLSYFLDIKELYSFTTLIKRIGNWKQVLSQTEEVLEPISQTQEIKPI